MTNERLKTNIYALEPPRHSNRTSKIYFEGDREPGLKSLPYDTKPAFSPEDLLRDGETLTESVGDLRRRRSVSSLA